MASSEEMVGSVLKVADLAAYLRVHPTTIYRLLKNHELPGFKVGSDWRFNRETIDRWRHGQMATVESKN